MWLDIARVIGGIYKPFTYETISSVSSASIGYTASIISPTDKKLEPTRAFCTVEGTQIRYRYDGTDPTETTGHIANVGDVIVMMGPDALANFEFISTTAGSTGASIKVTYER